MRDIIIIPTYNEKKNIGKLVKTIYSILPSVHLLVVDDNSPDGTAKEVEKLKNEIPNLELLLRPGKEGLGKAYIAAFKKVLTQEDIRCVCTMDADFSHSAEYLSSMFREIDNFSVVLGSRYIKGGGIKGWPLWRKVLSRAANLYCQAVLRLPTKDCTSGFLCIRTNLLRKVDLEKISASGFAFLIELKYYLWKNDGLLKEIPIIVENRKEGESKISTNIILEGISTSLKLISKKYADFYKKFLATLKEAFKKRGLFFIIFYGSKVFYYTFFRKNKDFFNFQGKKYNYFYHIYNCTCLNERAVEIPIVIDFLKNYNGKKILEVGNVFSHYFKINHDVLDKYEIAEGVINQDVVDFKPFRKYDLILSISTLEHVGWDENPKDSQKILRALENLKNCLAAGGKIIITLPLGYNLPMDHLLKEGKIKFTKQYFLERNSRKNEWKEKVLEGMQVIKYNFSQYTANGLVIGIIDNIC